ncbi:alpha/beta fold hydrolase [Halomonas sp. TBZ9]|uniref:Alpha/beta fold hydrolase n=1 Tax=Vreelandella azerica TaxID=2732867 RepID=A0A7Y3TWD2_9GAMM|nr:alpha/beta fold hydrolase [Halomonas azerica]NOG31128.1 alpha/beta fold hydrolase [Halomonas azerica]
MSDTEHDIYTVTLHHVDAKTEDADDSLPLIVIHGLLGSADNWRSHVKAWQENRRVIAVDLRNHGRSPHVEGMTYQAMSDDVLAVMDNLGIDQAHILGHSMGGKVAMTMARLAPQRVASLVVADIAPVAYSHGHDDVFAALNEVAVNRPANRRDADALLAKHVDARPIRLFLATNLERTTDNGQPVMGLRVGLEQIIKGYPDIVTVPAGDQPYYGPCLVLRGANSDYVSDAMLPALKQVLPNARVVTLKEAGHWLHADQPQAFQQAVESFVAAQSASC